MVYIILLENRERRPRNLFCSFIFTNGFSLVVQHSILLSVSLAGIALLQTLFSFKHFVTMIKLLKPASSVMLFPPTNPFLVLVAQTIPISFYMGKSKETLKSLFFLVLGSWVSELHCKAERDNIIAALRLSSSYLYFHFHLQLQPAAGTLVTPHHRFLAQANISATSKTRN